MVVVVVALVPALPFAFVGSRRNGFCSEVASRRLLLFWLFCDV